MLVEAGCVFIAFISLISGVQGQKKSICAFKGSSVDLPCSAQYTTSNNKWYTVRWNGSDFIQTELFTEENRVTFNTSEENYPTLTIKDLRETDAKFYCCKKNADNPAICFVDSIQLRVADLQVKVIPTTEGQTVTLMCSTSCPLTEKPAAYIWYKNGEFLYQDWSPWYQQLVSSDEAVTYSCAVKGYEDLRAPEVSVDSVTSICFNVTYAKGRMCSYKQTSVDESCSITYPTELHVQKTSVNYVTCRTSCPLTDPQTAYSWYADGNLYEFSESQTFLVISSAESYSCAVKGHEDLLSAEVCNGDKNCWRVNYISRRICALQDSSVNISSEYSHPTNQQPKSKVWYKMKRSGEEEAEELIEAAGRVVYRDNMNGRHILGIKKLQRTDSAEYIFRLQQQDSTGKQPGLPGVTLVVTDLTVKFTPSAEVTEGQRVTLTCSTSCPLPDNTTYIWYLNSQPLTLPENRHKHLVLDPVSSHHAGGYSCAVKTGKKEIISSEKTLTVQNIEGKKTAAAAAAAAGVTAVLLVIIALVVFLWIRRKRTSGQSPQPEATDNPEQLNPGPLYETISAQPAEQDDIHYSRVHFSKTQTDPPQPKEQEQVAYAVVNFRSNTTPE